MSEEKTKGQKESRAARRERIAMALMAGILANPHAGEDRKGGFARAAVEYADELLEALR